MSKAKSQVRMDIASRALDPTQGVDYQSNAVVSSTLINKAAGTITLFAFDAGQGLSEHSAPFNAMAVVLDGQAEIRIAGELHQVGTGEMIIMPANVPHALDARQDFKMLLIMIKS